MSLRYDLTGVVHGADSLNCNCFIYPYVKMDDQGRRLANKKKLSKKKSKEVAPKGIWEL